MHFEPEINTYNIQKSSGAVLLRRWQLHQTNKLNCTVSLGMQPSPRDASAATDHTTNAKTSRRSARIAPPIFPFLRRRNSLNSCLKTKQNKT